MRVVGILLQGNLEGAGGKCGFVDLRGRASPHLGYGPRVVRRLRVRQAALGLARHLELFQRAAQRFPSSAEAQYFVGIAARGYGNFALAETALRKSLTLKEGNVDALAQLGFIVGESGRQAEALRSISSARSTFAEELGIDLGAELHRLEMAVLDHDAALDLVPV